MNNRSIDPILAMEMRSRSAMATSHDCACAAHKTKITINQSKLIIHEELINRAGFGNEDEVPVSHGHWPRLRLRSLSIKITIDQSKLITMNNRSIEPVLAMETRSRSAMATGHVCACAVHHTKITVDQYNT
jgi:hypothetical protein